MSFVDALRKARRGPTTVLHEFKVNYDPNQRRVHAFVEGYEDVVFYKAAIESALRRDTRVYLYRCGNKRSVYEMFTKLTNAGVPPPKNILFFVDKDLSEIMGETWPIDERIYVTDVYSIENHFVSRAALDRLCADFIKLRGFEFDFAPVSEHFDEQLGRFHSAALTVMAWIACTRMSGLTPNINNIDMAQLFYMSQDCIIGARTGRAAYLARSTGVTPLVPFWSALLKQRRIMAATPPKQVIRGKFEIWFIVTFVRAIFDKLRVISEEVGGSASLKVNLNAHNIIEMLVGKIPTPISLQRFLNRHYPSQMELN